QVDCAHFGKRGAVPRKPRREHTIKHVHSARDHFHDLRGGPEPHRVTRPFYGQKRFAKLDCAHHFGFGFPNTNSTDCVSIEIQFDQGMGALFTQIAVSRSLNNTEEEGTIFTTSVADPIAATIRPTQCPLHTCRSVFPIAWIRGALVESHCY